MYYFTGGVLFAVAFYTMEDGQYVGGIKSSKNLYETLHNMWKQLYHEGRITKVTKNGAYIQFK